MIGRYCFITIKSVFTIKIPIKDINSCSTRCDHYLFNILIICSLCFCLQLCVVFLSLTFHQFSGQPIASVEMQATELYEIILQIEDERTQGASAQPSTGQQLSLSTNQVLTQTTGNLTNGL